MAEENTKKSSGAGKFFLGAALGAALGALAGKFISVNREEEEFDEDEEGCDCGEDCDCKDKSKKEEK